jgi:hypothetical protein
MAGTVISREEVDQLYRDALQMTIEARGPGDLIERMFKLASKLRVQADAEASSQEG